MYVKILNNIHFKTDERYYSQAKQNPINKIEEG